MNVDVAGRSLQQDVCADRRSGGIFGEAEHGALQRNVVGNVVAAGSGPGVRRSSRTALGNSGTSANYRASYNHEQVRIQRQLHRLTPFIELGFVSTNPKTQ